MRIQCCLVAAVIFVIAGAASEWTAAAGPRPGTDRLQLAQSAQTDPPRPATRRQTKPSGTQIACTRWGCNPIPRGCWIEAERGWDGLPTGFDAVVCPPR